ncbi:MAG: ExbD/TolR family protein, partial [Janthinobacterium lividum]
SDAPALIVMVGNDGALTLEGRPASLPTLGYALRAASGNDPTRRVVVGAEPKASPAQVGEVVSALSQSGFGRITITGP